MNLAIKSFSRALVLGLCLVASNVTAADSGRIDNTLLAATPLLARGQSATALPDGNWLLTGGVAPGRAAVDDVRLVDARTGAITVLSQHLLQARSNHATVVLRDGRVFIHGGTDQNGALLTTAELYTPATGRMTALGNIGLLARKGHAMTVQPDGLVLIAGGEDVRGTAVVRAELYNPASNTVESFNASLLAGLSLTSATMLPGGNTLLWASSGQKRQTTKVNLFDARSKQITGIDGQRAEQLLKPLGSPQRPTVVSAYPADQAVNIPLNAQLHVLLSKRMALSSLSSSTVQLEGKGKAVPAQIVGVNAGVLLFINPTALLSPSTEYILSISGATDEYGQALADVAYRFTTGNSVAAAGGWSTRQATTDQVSVKGLAVNAETSASAAVTTSSSLSSPCDAGERTGWVEAYSAGDSYDAGLKKSVAAASIAGDSGLSTTAATVGAEDWSCALMRQHKLRKRPWAGGCKSCDPVDIYTGIFNLHDNDLVIQDGLPIIIGRNHDASDTESHSFGVGGTLDYDMHLEGDVENLTYLYLILPDGSEIYYPRVTGAFPGKFKFKAQGAPGQYADSKIFCLWGRYCVLNKVDGTALRFANWRGDDGNVITSLIGVSSEYSSISIQRVGNGNIARVLSASGRVVSFEYDSERRVSSLKDSIGRVVKYDYYPDGHLKQVTDPENKTQKYTYDSNGNIWTVEDKRGNLMVTNEYDDKGRVKLQTFNDLTTNIFEYVEDAAGKVVQVDLTNERGFKTRYIYERTGFPVRIIAALGTPDEQTTYYERDHLTNKLNAVTDALGRRTEYYYEGDNLSRMILAAGTPEAVSYSYGYSPRNPYGASLSSVTDPLNHTTRYEYLGFTHLSAVIDANNNTQRYEYHNGRLKKYTNGLGKETVYTHDADSSDISGSVDPLGNATTYYRDAIGRITGMVDSMGSHSLVGSDGLGRITSTTDPLKNKTVSVPDGNGNVTAVFDGKINEHGFEYDGRNNSKVYRDPLKKSTTADYDGVGNMIYFKDRNGNHTDFKYDGLNRLKKVTYHDGGTIDYEYDDGNRVRNIIDSINGTLSFTYNSQDNILTATTPRGLVAYTYYENGLRKTMTVNSQPTISYLYDDGNRLKEISQAAGPSNGNVAQVTKFYYYDDNRRKQTILPNGVSINYGYDDAGRMTTIDYRNDSGTLIGDLSYSYDANGQRISRSGSFDKTSQSSGTSGIVIDAANRLKGAGGRVLGYDNNGNLISDGVRTYTWNVRNQLEKITVTSTGAAVASFTYDALGRRQSKIIGAESAGFVYDQENIVQELVNATVDNGNSQNVRYNFITGLGVDERFAMFSVGGSNVNGAYYLTDAIGTTMRLTDASGSKIVDYTYDSYGNTNADAVHSNVFQYTGRENDGITGMYYYRARYYSPKIGRFISEDPIRFVGGVNFYAYTGGNPIRYRDPSGLLFSGSVNAGEGFGDSAAQYWADRYVNDSGLTAAFDGLMGGFASLWTPCTSDSTALTLLGARTLPAAANWAAWAGNPVMYELGAKTVSTSVWMELGLANMSLVERGAAIWSKFGLSSLGISSGPWLSTLAQGPTPGGWLASIGFLNHLKNKSSGEKCPCD